MRILAIGVALLLLVAACSATDPWRAEAATAIGDELSGRLVGPLALAADTADDTDLDALKNALDAALDDMTLPPGGIPDRSGIALNFLYWWRLPICVAANCGGAH